MDHIKDCNSFWVFLLSFKILNFSFNTFVLDTALGQVESLVFLTSSVIEGLGKGNYKGVI